jgi:hypothetical protein
LCSMLKITDLASKGCCPVSGLEFKTADVVKSADPPSAQIKSG